MYWQRSSAPAFASARLNPPTPWCTVLTKKLSVYDGRTLKEVNTGILDWLQQRALSLWKQNICQRKVLTVLTKPQASKGAKESGRKEYLEREMLTEKEWRKSWTRWWNQKQAARFRFPLCGIISKAGWMGFGFLISFLWLSEWLEESSNATRSFPPGQVAQITGLCFCIACLLIVGFYLMGYVSLLRRT